MNRRSVTVYYEVGKVYFSSIISCCFLCYYNSVYIVIFLTNTNSYEKKKYCESCFTIHLCKLCKLKVSTTCYLILLRILSSLCTDENDNVEPSHWTEQIESMKDGFSYFFIKRMSAETTDMITFH